MLLFCTNDCDDVLFRVSPLGQLHVDIIGLPQLVDDGSGAANDLGVVFGQDLEAELEAAQGTVGLLLLKLNDLECIIYLHI